jgi:phosphopantetheinyl transferase
MPLILTETVNPDITIKVWRLDEPVEELLEKVKLDSEEEDYFRSFGNEKRRKQWLGYRLLLQQMFVNLPLKISYDKFGKPFIPDSDNHFSVSHSGDYAVVIVDKKNFVGIDIEKIRDRIERVKERFLSDKELRDISNDHRLEKLHVCWGAKESLYKSYGKPDVDFKTDMHLEQFDYLCIGKGNFNATMNLPSGTDFFTIHYQKIENYMLVWAIKIKS